jgi:hypothetical protein
MRRSREVTAQQIALIDQKMANMAAMRDTLRERIEKYDASLARWAAEQENAPAPTAAGE